MSTEIVIVVIAAIVGPILVVLITEIFRHLNSKKEKEERLFYELFPKRLELYEEIIKTLDYVEDSEIPFFTCKTAWELSTYYKEKCNLLANLGFRCIMFGSAKVSHLITILHTYQADALPQK